MDVAWNLSALSRYANTAEGREVAGNHSAARAKVANVPQCRQTFVLQHRIVTLIARNRTESPLHSGFVGRPHATLEKRSPINKPIAMNPIIKNIIAVIIGFFVGSLVNMAIIMVSSSVIPPPEGADVTTLEGLKASMHLFGPQNFIMPFLAHALGTFIGALVAAVMAANNKMKFALGIGAFFLIGGVANVVMLPSPLWFSVLDLGIAYIPMGYLAGKVVTKN